MTKKEILEELAAKYRHHAEMSGAGSTRDHFLEVVKEVEEAINDLRS